MQNAGSEAAYGTGRIWNHILHILGNYKYLFDERICVLKQLAQISTLIAVVVYDGGIDSDAASAGVTNYVQACVVPIMVNA